MEFRNVIRSPQIMAAIESAVAEESVRAIGLVRYLDLPPAPRDNVRPWASCWSPAQGFYERNPEQLDEDE